MRGDVELKVTMTREEWQAVVTEPDFQKAAAMLSAILRRTLEAYAAAIVQARSGATIPSGKES